MKAGALFPRQPKRTIALFSIEKPARKPNVVVRSAIFTDSSAEIAIIVRALGDATPTCLQQGLTP
jgi:hypothetical protein